MINLKVTITALVISFTSYNCEASTISDIISKIENNLTVKVVYNIEVQDTWSSISYENCNDSTEFIEYLLLLDKEYAKYPKGYFQIVGINTIVLGKKLKFQNQYRAAIPDPYIQSLFLSIDGAYGDFSTTYLVHVMHHELHHCTEYAIWENMNYEWEEWAKTNRASFSYKGSGENAYEDNSIDWYSMVHPENGFLNYYSTTAQEEDRSELIALIMSDIERKYIFQYYSEDEILRKKIDLILKELNRFSQTEDNYWQNRISEFKGSK